VGRSSSPLEIAGAACQFKGLAILAVTANVAAADRRGHLSFLPPRPDQIFLSSSSTNLSIDLRYLL